MEEIVIPLEKDLHQIELEDVVRGINLPLHKFSFLSSWKSCCIGFVDAVDSTKITALLEHKEMCEYYRIFLNWMGIIAQEFDAIIVKNIGDSILYYFPRTLDGADKDSLRKALECGLAMIESYPVINKFLQKKGLPAVKYRVSSDYGKLAIAKSSTSGIEDIFGPTVNVCTKINSLAFPNQMVIGGDLYQISRSLKEYCFNQISPYSLGQKFDYPVYSMCRTALE